MTVDRLWDLLKGKDMWVDFGDVAIRCNVIDVDPKQGVVKVEASCKADVEIPCIYKWVKLEKLS